MISTFRKTKNLLSFVGITHFRFSNNTNNFINKGNKKQTVKPVKMTAPHLQKIVKLIQDRNVEQIGIYVRSFVKNQGQNQNISVQILELLNQLQQTPLKYQTLKQFFNSAEIHQLKKKKSKKVERELKTFINNFLNSPLNQNTQVVSLFEQAFKSARDKKLISSNILQSIQAIEVVAHLYFGKSNNRKTYEKFFQVLKNSNSSNNTSEDFQQFYKNFSNALSNFQLKTTQLRGIPLPANSELVSNYHKFIQTKNVPGILASLLICLQNKYLSVPHHFLTQKANDFKKLIPSTLLQKVQNQTQIQQIKYYIKENQIEQANKVAEQIVSKNQKSIIMHLKAAIVSKNYQKSMQIFFNHLLKKICIQKQRKIISKVYLYLFNRMNIDRSLNREQKQFKETLKEFIAGLDDEFLIQSWKKREDAGYLFEDFYVKQNIYGTKQQKQQQRFSFWQKYFAEKRLTQISRLEKLNQLNTIREPNQQPYIENQFNLNQYLGPENYQTYREAADYNDKKYIQMLLYIYKAEEALLDYQRTGDSKAATRILNYQNSLCEQNLQKLQSFGLKDYDISQYDVQQFGNRIKHFKNVKGIHRYDQNAKRFDHFQINYEQIQQAIKNEQKKMRQLRQKMRAQRAAKLRQQAAKEAGTTQETPATQQAVVQEAVVEEAVAEEAVAEEVAAQQAAQQATEQTAVQQVEQQAVIPEHVSSKNISKILSNTQNPLQLINLQFLTLLQIKNIQLFRNASINTPLRPLEVVNNLIKWGLLAREPMAIYMGQKIAMSTCQIIPHDLAIRVSDMLSYYREIDESLFVECKKCLSYIGKIQREFIYDDNKKYHHIAYKPYLDDLIKIMDSHIKDRLEDLTSPDFYLPRKNQEPRQVMRRISKGPVI